MFTTTVSDEQKLLKCDKCGKACSCTTYINGSAYCNDCLPAYNTIWPNGTTYPWDNRITVPWNTSTSTKIITNEPEFIRNQVLVERVENGYLLEKDNKEYIAKTLQDVVELLEQLIPEGKLENNP